MSNKKKYKNICESETSIPLFSKDWWLDAVCGEQNWDVAIVENNNKVIAALPYHCKKKYGFRYIINPILTQRLGIWLKYPENQNYINKLGFEKKIYQDLLKQLPRHSWFNQNIFQNTTNWLPMYWKGYKQTTLYTYIIEETKYENALNNYSTTAKRGIRKASEKLKVQENLDFNSFYSIVNKTFNKQNQDNLYPKKILEKLINECNSRKCGKTIYAIDDEQQIHSVLFFVWDNNYLTMIVEGNDIQLGNNYGKYLLFDYAIKFGLTKKLNIDFEGSIIQPIEHVNRQFGARQVPYFQISKINSRFLKLLYSLKV